MLAVKTVLNAGNEMCRVYSPTMIGLPGSLSLSGFVRAIMHSIISAATLRGSALPPVLSFATGIGRFPNRSEASHHCRVVRVHIFSLGSITSSIGLR